MRHTIRNSKGQFCKADTETPDLPINDEIGYSSVYAYKGDDPPFKTVKAYKVEEHCPCGTPVCYPYEHDPDKPLYLTTFADAMQDAKDNNIMIQLSVYNAMASYLPALNGDDFYVPEGFCEPKFKIGDQVYAVEMLHLLGMTLTACRGTIIGIRYDYGEDGNNKSMPKGWYYTIYFKRKATEQDTAWGAKVGTILDTEELIPEDCIYPDKETAQRAFRDAADLVMKRYARLHRRIMKLKPQDLKPEN